MVDPVFGHVGQKIEAAKGFYECIDWWAFVDGDCGEGTVWTGGFVGRGDGVVLTVQIAVGCIGAVAEIRP